MSGTTTNYGWTYPSSTDYVKDGASAMQTIATGIDTTLYTINAGSAKVGMHLLNTTAFTSQSSVSITNIFNSTYDNYHIELRLDVSTPATILLRMGNGGVFNSSNNYGYGGYLSANTSSSGTFGGGVGSGFNLGEALTQFTSSINLLSPNLTKNTNANYHGSSDAYYAWNYAGGMTVSTAYTDLGLVITSGNMTGTISVYGYRKS